MTATRVGIALVTGSLRIPRTTLGHQIAAELRREILFGKIRPRTRLSQRGLCEDFGTSRIPVRDALRELAHEGFVTIDEAGHARVVDLSRQDIEDVFRLEAVIHGMAGRRAVANAKDSDIDRLAQLDLTMRESSEAEKCQRFSELNWRFHREINNLAGSTKPLAFVRSISLNIPRYYVTELPEWMSRANEEHAQIVGAMRERDSELTSSLLQTHIESAGENLITYLNKIGTFDLALCDSYASGGLA